MGVMHRTAYDTLQLKKGRGMTIFIVKGVLIELGIKKNNNNNNSVYNITFQFTRKL